MVINYQYFMYYANIPMNVIIIINVVTMQRHRCYINVPMNIFATMNTLTTQLGTSCSFDSPGLPNDSAGYPGLTYGLRGTTP